jgi:hypothetical protein
MSQLNIGIATAHKIKTDEILGKTVTWYMVKTLSFRIFYTRYVYHTNEMKVQNLNG